MNRREFVKRAGVGLGGLVGLERLVKALAGEPAYATTICPASPTTTPGYSVCESNNNNVHCYGVESGTPPAYRCDGNYLCNSNFTCEDFTCFQNGNGDFECHSTFDCAINQDGSQFQCDGNDLFGYQFKCTTPFSCFPSGEGTRTQRFWCDDFYCQEGQFHCYGKYGEGCVGHHSARPSRNEDNR